MTLLFTLIRYLCQALTIALVLRALISWFPINPSNPVSTVLYCLTEPLVAPLRRIIPRLGMLDITPLLAIMLLQTIYHLIP